jgi:hypothetical protein
MKGHETNFLRRKSKRAKPQSHAGRNLSANQAKLIACMSARLLRGVRDNQNIASPQRLFDLKKSRDFNFHCKILMMIASGNEWTTDPVRNVVART